MFDRLVVALLSPFDSLRRRLAILFAVVLLPPTALSLYFAWSAFELQIDKARLSVRQYAILVSAYERDYFRDIQRLLTTLAAAGSPSLVFESLNVAELNRRVKTKNSR